MGKQTIETPESHDKLNELLQASPQYADWKFLNFGAKKENTCEDAMKAASIKMGSSI